MSAAGLRLRRDGELELVAGGVDEVEGEVHPVAFRPALAELLERGIGARHPVVPEGEAQVPRAALRVDHWRADRARRQNAGARAQCAPARNPVRHSRILLLGQPLSAVPVAIPGG